MATEKHQPVGTLLAGLTPSARDNISCSPRLRNAFPRKVSHFPERPGGHVAQRGEPIEPTCSSPRALLSRVNGSAAASVGARCGSVATCRVPKRNDRPQVGVNTRTPPREEPAHCPHQIHGTNAGEASTRQRLSLTCAGAGSPHCVQTTGYASSNRAQVTVHSSGD